MPVAPNQHLLDRAVDRQIAGRRGRPFGNQRTPGRTSRIAPRGQEPQSATGSKSLKVAMRWMYLLLAGLQYSSWANARATSSAGEPAIPSPGEPARWES